MFFFFMTCFGICVYFFIKNFLNADYHLEFLIFMGSTLTHSQNFYDVLLDQYSLVNTQLHTHFYGQWQLCHYVDLLSFNIYSQAMIC